MEKHDFQKEREFEASSIAVSTTTSYPTWYAGKQLEDERTTDKVRGDLAIETIRQAEQNGFRVVVVDGGSSKDFVNRIKESGVILLTQSESGMGASRRQVLKEASGLSGVGVICWIEPEKVSVVKECLPQAIYPILDGTADIVVPARAEDTFNSYPKYQVESERKLNKMWNSIVKNEGFLAPDREDLDISFGPKFFRNTPEILDLFLAKYKIKGQNAALQRLTDPDRYANSMSFPIVAALAKGYKVLGVEVPYTHPPRQTELETGNEEYDAKRDSQRRDIISSTIEFIRVLKSSPKAKVEAA
jgi:glycosyltransferase involved in cell wall biosynthesis